MARPINIQLKKPLARKKLDPNGAPHDNISYKWIEIKRGDPFLFIMYCPS